MRPLALKHKLCTELCVVPANIPYRIKHGAFLITFRPFEPNPNKNALSIYPVANNAKSPGKGNNEIGPVM